MRIPPHPRRQYLADHNDAAIYSIGLIAQVLPYIPYTILADSIQAMVPLITEGPHLVHILLAIENILANKEIGNDQIEKILAQLLQLHIDQADLNLCHAYLQSLRQAVISLHPATLYLPSVISSMTEFLLQSNYKIQKVATAEIVKVIEVLGEDLLKSKQTDDMLDDIMTLNIENDGMKQYQAANRFIAKYLSVMCYLLSSRFDDVQQHVTGEGAHSNRF